MAVVESATQIYALGLKALVRFCSDQKLMDWYKAKLVATMFKGDELAAFEWVHHHVKQYHALPQLESLEAEFPELAEVHAPEPSKYYVDKLERRFFYETINKANVASHDILKDDKEATEQAEEVLRGALSTIALYKYRTKIVDVGVEGPKMILQAYHKIDQPESVLSLGWPYMDDQSGGAYPGDVVITVGRPAAGKTYLTLHGAIKNWKAGRRVLLISMEMTPLPLLQRISAMHASTNVTQLKISGYSTATYLKFKQAVFEMPLLDGKMFIVDGNLAASVDDIYELASQLKVDGLYIDGAYLLKHPNKKLGRYERVAENTELIKKRTTDLGIPSFPSYQLSREADKKKVAKQKVDLSDIGYSDTIGQIGSIIYGLFQEEGIETMARRHITLMKGRNGEIGGFDINWLFTTMNFEQVGHEVDGKLEVDDKPELDFL